MSSRAYDLVRTIVEDNGGEMYYQVKGYRYGAWIIEIGNKRIAIESQGNQSFPELDQLYVPKVSNPRYWDDYYNELVDGAEAKLLEMFNNAPNIKNSEEN